MKRLADKLGFRVAFMLAAALLPLTIISVIKSTAVLEESRARAEAAVLGETLRETSGELLLIQEARGAATILAHMVWPLADDPAACSQLLGDLIQQEAQYSLIAFVPIDGQSICNSEMRPVDFSEDPLFLQADKELVTSFAVKPLGFVSGESVLAISHPVFDSAGLYRGLVSVSLPHSGLRVAEDSPEGEEDPVTMLTFDKTGTVLTSSLPMEDFGPAIPRDRALSVLAGDRSFSFSGLAASGEMRVFSVVPLVPNELYALGSRPPDRALRGTFAAVPVLFPALMWIASLVVAWLATERLVIRHIRKLSASLRSFASGNRLVGDIEVGAAPVELREMAAAYERMTETILHDEAELEDTIHQKEVLLREVHHRVKNNLQLIASIMNMQMRRTRSPEAKVLMRSLQDRVMSLAMIHRELYQTEGLSDIHADELLSIIVRHITNIGDSPDRHFSVSSELDDIRMTPDQAVPVALLVAEMMTNAMKYAQGHDDRPAEIGVRFRALEGSQALLEVRNSVGPELPGGDEDQTAMAGDQGRTGLGTQLITSFAMQLGGAVVRERKDGYYTISVRFALTPLADAEERNRAGEDN